MGSDAERRSNDAKIAEAIALACRGNEDATSYLVELGFVSRVMDDLIDRDFAVPPENICRAFFWLLAGMWMNPFFRAHEKELVALHMASFNAWMDANKWEGSHDRLRRIYAHVMKDTIDEIIAVVAYLVGGYRHMREVSVAVKETFLEEV